MVSLKWCCKQKGGIRLIEPSDNLAQSYIEMAEKSIGTMNRERDYNLVFSISACYYSMYYSLYAVLMKLGIKCEIHSCSIEAMKSLLQGFYSPENVSIIKKAFDLRNIAQYYVDKVIDENEIDYIMKKASLFVDNSRKILSRINDNDAERIRREFEGLK